MDNDRPKQTSTQSNATTPDDNVKEDKWKQLQEAFGQYDTDGNGMSCSYVGMLVFPSILRKRIVLTNFGCTRIASVPQ